MLMTMYASTLQGEEALAAFAEGERLLNEVVSTGYNDGVGNVYYFLFHCYYGQKEKNRDEYLAKAKESLLTGIKLFPKNATILDGLMQLYTAEEGVGDPAELTTMIENSLKEPRRIMNIIAKNSTVPTMADTPKPIKAPTKGIPSQSILAMDFIITRT